jgi:predicted AlkP superfamily phosphohydrolase/phosphomutase
MKSRLILRGVLAIAGLFALTTGLSGCGSTSQSSADVRNVVVLGIDGMDPQLLEKFVAKGRMPNFKRLMETGSYAPLGTSIPPQSPVAWSNFITGMDPGGHGIFDFMHRDPETYLPEFSTALVADPAKTLKLGSWVIPLSKGKVELLRRGKAFWQHLDEAHVPYLIFRIPSNFPPVDSKGTSVSGMGTPDLLGTYGTFSYYTDDPTMTSLKPSGGEVYPVHVEDDRVDADLIGPENSLREKRPKLTYPFTVYRDREHQAAKFVVGKKAFILQAGEWSEWIDVDFPVIGPLNTVSGICRFYLKSVSPHFDLYVTPININPDKPALPISYPAAFEKALYKTIGYHYTQGMPEDTKALEWGVLSDAEFIRQVHMVFAERIRMLDAILDDYRSGLLFFYFSSLDQATHMLWRNMDPDHPAHTLEAAKHQDALENLYARMDSVLGVVEKRIPENTTLIVMSDHGFAPFNKKFSLNGWLYQNGYLTLKRPDDIGKQLFFRNVFWRRSKAYGLGINGLYVNLYGRERFGTVQPGEQYEALLDELSGKLLAYRDPETGEQVITRVYRRDEVFHGEAVDIAPDLVVGYKRGYRCSDDSALGTLSDEIITLNTSKWSGDHLMDHTAVPGVLLANLPLLVQAPDLKDLPTTIMGFYGLENSEVMKGRRLFE